MNAAQIAAALRALANIHLTKGNELRARCLGVSAFEIEELTPEELERVGIHSGATA